jgi:hypothetical protein
MAPVRVALHGVAVPIQQRIVFAGEAVLVEPHGSLHAAYQSGIAAGLSALGALSGVG